MEEFIPVGELRHLQEGTEYVKSQIDFSQEELDAMREQLFLKEAEIDDLKEQLSEVSKDLKAKIKEQVTSRTLTKKKVRQGFDIVDVECFKVPDHDRGMMGYYNANTGRLEFSRRLQPEERQLRAPLRIAHND